MSPELSLGAGCAEGWPQLKADDLLGLLRALLRNRTAPPASALTKLGACGGMPARRATQVDPLDKAHAPHSARAPYAKGGSDDRKP